jgi:hypothetical protein
LSSSIAAIRSNVFFLVLFEGELVYDQIDANELLDLDLAEEAA